MSVLPNRMVVYVKDVQNITGRSERTSQNLLTAVRKRYNKKRGEFITVEEFCDYLGFKTERVKEFLK